jgi:hypothetical protein
MSDRESTPAPPAPAHVSEKWDAYLDTVLEFPEIPGVSVDLRAPVTPPTRRALRELVGGETFGVFTAENPAGQNVEDAPSDSEERRREAENDRRTSRLERELTAREVVFHRVDGVSPDGSYRERCVAALLPREEAMELARRYEQLALFWFDGNRFWLLPGTAPEEARTLP